MHKKPPSTLSFLPLFINWICILEQKQKKKTKVKKKARYFKLVLLLALPVFHFGHTYFSNYSAYPVVGCCDFILQLLQLRGNAWIGNLGVFSQFNMGRFCGFQKQVRLFPVTKRCIKPAKRVASQNSWGRTAPSYALKYRRAFHMYVYTTCSWDYFVSKYTKFERHLCPYTAYPIVSQITLQAMH